MEQPPKTGKRIVSKREYAILIGKREVRRWGSIVLSQAVAMCILCTVGFIIGGLLADTVAWQMLCFAIALVCLPIAYFLKNVAEKAMQQALTKIDVVPVTRANTADLPAPDSLVRASQEPAQAQEAMLLRATTLTPQTQPEQLLRAAARRQEQE